MTANAASDRVALIVLAAGAGTRMKSSLAKPLHPVAGKPMIEWVLAAGAALEPAETVVVISKTLDELKSVAAVRTAVQDPPAGTGDALRVALDEIGDVDWVAVFFADHPLLTTSIVSELFSGAKRSGATVTVLTCWLDDGAEYGRIDRDDAGRPIRIVEKSNDDPEKRTGRLEVNSGMMVIDARWAAEAVKRLKPNPPKNEYYLTDLLELAIADFGSGDVWPVATVNADPDVMKGINDRVQLAEAEKILFERIRRRHLLNGVSIVGPETVFIDETVEIAPDTRILPFSILRGTTSIGSNCVIGPSANIRNSTIGSGVAVVASTLVDATIADGSDVGPYAHLRAGARIGPGVHVGNYAEVKNSTLERGVKVGHFSYIGDATIGEQTNIGAGTVTANYDGVRKNETTIGKDAFIGSGSMLVAPLTIGDDAIVGAGSVVTRDVPAGEKVMGVPARPAGAKRLSTSVPDQTEVKVRDDS
jgi:bifunctional UDP-N-acetylglucosamine pyrophosphorylase/glucosamine-1-phosphate N-acetyltransferase